MKLSKSTKTVIIAAGVLLVLGVVLMVHDVPFEITVFNHYHSMHFE